MLKVKTVIKTSSIQGLGLFAAEFIPKGAVIWERTSQSVAVLSLDEVLSSPEPFREFLLNYTYRENGGYILCLDNDRIVNHSDSPNTFEGDTLYTTAAVDIGVGEEITGDYFEFDLDAGFKLGR